ncbi:MAG TPA: adenylyltransferase/cytidyltransferase family protein [Syntrophorhabdus sp.]|mgnify:CR=1 FL=1|jgi:rfaE bifunctional protein nucleotidyltransferase chain/domain|nr:adenylyltransferase/cytidyltransferase family protein [Syntrophorhabdus sp.]OQB76178.1 MAG: Bifunctional protein HldE [Deltaproteobacteria bacterium ADurb.Bin135]HNQ46389.1 adenylyltransferase/cytidyltransferase family protein [Syntrophorhabdus sp.]HPB38021.1 adenylyltransferase/cytidyltransferase family protein [Syntrophorhabdus sp.]HPW36127.1 adenylyltransferase/cytidyltransferase family protein [Syntrophorhabdus sp.]
MGQIVKKLDELKSIVEKEKNQGKKIVFGNGCFDLLHVGHVRYLKGAKALGDVLIVAVNDDSSVMGLGKRKRVVTPAPERAEIIAALEGVDYVILFSDPNVENLLRTLQPHIHAKGTDYTEESVPEGRIVRDYGGRVAIVGDPKDHSTRDLIKAIKDMD